MPPTWKAHNLSRHHRERLRKDQGCFEDLLGLSATLTESQYEMRSHDAVTNAWAECEGRSWEAGRREYSADERAYYVDKGVRFLFLLAGTPGRIVSLVAVDLGLAP